MSKTKYSSNFYEQHKKEGEDTLKLKYSFMELWDLKDKEQRFLIDDVLPRGLLSMINGEDGIGKTILINQICLSICLGHKQIFGQKMDIDSGKCLIVSTEESKEKFARTLIKQAFAIEGGQFKPNDIRPKLDFIVGDDANDSKHLFETIEAAIIAEKYDFVVIDCFQDVISGLAGKNINSGDDVNEVLNPYKKLAERHDSAVMFVHHVSKTKVAYKKKTESSFFIEKDFSFGSGRITSKPRVILSLSHDKNSILQEGKYFTNSNYLHITKSNVTSKKFVMNALKLDFDSKTLLHSLDKIVNIREVEESSDNEASYNGSPDNKPNTIKPTDMAIDYHLSKVDSIFEGRTNIEEEAFKKSFCKLYNIPIRSFNRGENSFYKYLKDEKIIIRASTGFIMKGIKFKDYEPPF